MISKKTVRHRIDYNYANDDKRKERELVDVVYEPVGEKITRELTIHQYHLDSGKTKSMTWAQYEQIGQSSDAALVYHIALYYDPVGIRIGGWRKNGTTGKRSQTILTGIRLDKVRWGTTVAPGTTGILAQEHYPTDTSRLKNRTSEGSSSKKEATKLFRIIRYKLR